MIFFVINSSTYRELGSWFSVRIAKIKKDRVDSHTWSRGWGGGLWDRSYMDHHVEDWLHMYTQLCTEQEFKSIRDQLLILDNQPLYC